MWTTVKQLSILTSLSTRAIQKKAQNGELTYRYKDNKTMEIDLSSLPEDMRRRLPESLRKETGALTAISQASSLLVTPAQQSALGRSLTKKEKQKLETVRYYKALNPLQAESIRAAITANYFGISVSTVRRYVKELDSFGILGKTKKTKKSAFDPEAELYIKGYYLSFMRNTNIQQKKPAWVALQKMAKEKGWKIGCRASAYTMLDEIPEILKRYAIAGNRALDNFYFIRRDWNNLKPSEIWIGDQHVCDYWVMDPECPDKPYRPVIYLWEDGATRMVAGLAVGRGSYDSDTVIESIRVGIRRFGFFECTYNDNGTAECAKATTSIIDDLTILSDGRCQMKDVSDLYKTEDGTYIVEDQNGEPVTATGDVESWRKMRRRIYANVKNAKAKPIERLFNTLETMLAGLGIPGHVVDPMATADQEEKEQQQLDRWIRNGDLLTLDEFVRVFVSVVDRYEHTPHSSLKMSPCEVLQKHISAGWRATRPASEMDLDFVFLSRTQAKIRKGRVLINGIEYMGEGLKSVVSGYADIGLTLHEGEICEIRYDKLDPTIAYAVFPSSAVKIRALQPVKPISMLDDVAMENAISWKRHQMKVTRELFFALEKPASIMIESKISKQVEKARKSVEESEEGKNEEKEMPVIYRQSNTNRLFHSDFEHYQACLETLVDGRELMPGEIEFMAEYESRPEYAFEKARWDVLKNLGGLK